MLAQQEAFKAKLGKFSAKTLSLGGKQFVRGRNEQKIRFAEEFSYAPLSGPRCIRLLKIHEGEDTAVVACDVFEVLLDDKPLFEALSYTWDLDREWDTWKFTFVDDTKREERPILCNGKTRHVTMNLYNALIEFRRMKWQLPIWADQICINQQDEKEKIAQLAIMAQVYQSASRVIVWLGQLSNFRRNALDFMESLPKDSLRRSTSHEVSNPSSDQLSERPKLNKISRSFGTISALTNVASDQYHWISTLRVLGRKWFDRAWTLQELLLAPNFVIFMGGRRIAPETFANASRKVIEFYSTDPMSTMFGLSVSFFELRRYILGRGTVFSEREQFQNGKRYSAEDYLGIIRVRGANEPRDKLLAGTALLEKRKSNQVDFHTTTLDMYVDFATSQLWPEKGVFSLSLVGGVAPKVDGIPSWAPDLTCNLRPEPLRYCGSPAIKIPIPTQGNEYRIDGRTLYLKGVTWDIVKEVAETNWSWTKYDEHAYNDNPRFKMRSPGPVTNERFGLMFSLVNQLGQTYAPTGERTIDVFWQTLIAQTHIGTEHAPDVWSNWFCQWFAFTLLAVQSYMWEELHPRSRLVSFSSTKKWIVPLVADFEPSENRLKSFLDVHDQEINESNDSPPPLRRTISHVSQRLWGVETPREAGFWKGSTEELFSALRGESFHQPISLFGEQFEKVYDGRRIFISEKGYLGIAVESVRAGDVIMLVAGADVPYIFRPVGAQENTFTLVGEAYIHGITNGNSVGEDNMEVVGMTVI